MVEFDSEVQWIPIAEIKPNDYNPNFVPQQLYNDIIDDIKRNKFIGAIVINKKNIIIDGEHRWRALKSLGATKVPCIVKDIDEKDSKILTIRLNRERGFLVPIETGQLLTDLSEKIPIDILSETTAIPLDELNLLTNIKYDPILQEQEKTDSRLMWNDIETLVTTLVEQIQRQVTDIMEIYTISRGGLIPARLIADRLNIKSIKVLTEPLIGGVIIDDIYDSGKTYNKFGKQAGLYAVLHLRKDKKPPKNLIYSRETDGQEYIVYPWDKNEFNRMKSTRAR